VANDVNLGTGKKRKKKKNPCKVKRKKRKFSRNLKLVGSTGRYYQAGHRFRVVLKL
jgi:hypothetical protein